jgi:polyferredoxin
VRSVKIKRPKPLQLVRYVVQFAVAAYVLLIAIAGTVGAQWAANLHTICPFGGVANLYTYMADGGYVAKLHSAVFIMLLALLIGLVLTGKSFCGWICPLGSIQQALGWIGQRLWPRAYNRVPRRLESIFQYLKWVVLAWVLVQTARSGRLIFQDWDPYYNLYRIWTDEVAISGYAVAGVTLVLALLIPRAFCRYGCPLGAFNGLFNSFSFVGIKRDAATCTDCGRCNKVCPVNIDVCAASTIRSIECTRCLKCVEACPQNARTGDTLKLHTWFSGIAGLRRPRPKVALESAAQPRTRVSRRSVSVWTLGSLAVAAFVLPILITNLSGDFQISGGRGQGSGGGAGRQESVEPTGGESGYQPPAEDSAEAPQTIRGTTTLADLQAMGVDVASLLAEFGIPVDTPLDTMLKQVTEPYGVEMSELRAYVETTPH